MEELQNKKRKNRFTLFIIVIFGILICFLSYNLWKGNEKIEILNIEIDNQQKKQEEKRLDEIDLRSNLDKLINDHQNLLDDYDIQDENLLKQDSLINQLKKEIEDLLNTKKDLKQARKKIVSLQEISQRYFQKIDSLLTFSEGLVIKNDSLIRTNRDITYKNQDLNQRNTNLSSIIDRGSALRIFNIEVQKIKYGTMRKEADTKKAKKVQILRCCFSVSSNAIAKTENKKVFIQYINPNGELLFSSTSPKNSEFLLGDSLLDCTTYISFDYQNEEVELCLDWQRGDMLIPGNYKILFFIEGKKVGTSFFILN
ncbi:MAG: hypothetical protein HN427_07395 [Flavobacteriales bacterium]|nr:hypothetical protein [Flavobacteriales bacterium]